MLASTSPPFSQECDAAPLSSYMYESLCAARIQMTAFSTLHSTFSVKCRLLREERSVQQTRPARASS